MPAALAHPADDLLVGQHGTQRGAPIHRRFELIGQPVLVAVPLDGRLALGRNLVGDRQLGDRPALLLAASNHVSNSTRKMNCVQRK